MEFITFDYNLFRRIKSRLEMAAVRLVWGYISWEGKT